MNEKGAGKGNGRKDGYLEEGVGMKEDENDAMNKRRR